MPQTAKLRCKPCQPAFHVVLLEPEIPPNTGAVARTCAATQCPLHLVGPLGFDISERAVKRAGLDYWHLVDLRRHESFEALLEQEPDRPFHLFSAEGNRSYLEADLQPGDMLVFGRESVGLPRELLARYPERVCGIPTAGGVRSLNLSNAVAIALFEGLRRSGALRQTYIEPAPGTDPPTP